MQYVSILKSSKMTWMIWGNLGAWPETLHRFKVERINQRGFEPRFLMFSSNKVGISSNIVGMCHDIHWASIRYMFTSMGPFSLENTMF